MLRAWFAAFVFTQLVEVPIYMRGLGVSAAAAFGASAITHPLVWFGFFSPAWTAGYSTKVVAAELFAWLAEAAYFRYAFSRRRSLVLSLVANAASLGLGLLSRHLFGMP